MISRARFPSLTGRCGGFVFLALFLSALGQARAGTVGVPISLSIVPSTVHQGEDNRTILKTTVTLQAPSPGYFICEVRSQEKRKMECTSIIFQKGDINGIGNATVFWNNIANDTTIKVSAFNVDAPDTIVSCTVKLQVKDEKGP